VATALEDRFWKKVAVGGRDECWLWQGATANGYGRAYSRVRDGKYFVDGAHRIAYELTNGPIPDGLQIDHLCRNRLCVNPTHLEVVTQRENLLRGETIPARRAAQTHCVNGHEFTPENTYRRKEDGVRQCRACNRERKARAAA
jgi:hypothetical protein